MVRQPCLDTILLARSLLDNLLPLFASGSLVILPTLVWAKQSFPSYPTVAALEEILRCATIDMYWAVILSSASAERRILNIIHGRCSFGRDCFTLPLAGSRDRSQ